LTSNFFTSGINSALNPIIEIPHVAKSSGTASISAIRPDIHVHYKCDSHLSPKLWFISHTWPWGISFRWLLPVEEETWKRVKLQISLTIRNLISPDTIHMKAQLFHKGRMSELKRPVLNRRCDVMRKKRRYRRCISLVAPLNSDRPGF
jgi:hypothetical protein